MAKSKSNRKTRSDKFPLTLHPTGQYCKKIRGKLYYFGTDKKIAHTRYLEQAADLHAGKRPKPESINSNSSIKDLCNLYLDHQESRALIGEITLRHLHDQISRLRNFAKFIGPNQLVSEISTIDVQNYRRKLIKSGKSPNTINNHIAAVKSMYNWAVNNEILDRAPNMKAIKKITKKKEERPTFTPTQLRALLKHASVQMKAMIWLGLNCAYGCTDCAELKWENLDFKKRRIDMPRGKTGVERNFELWPETIEALKKVPKSGDLVFYTRRGNPWVRTVRTVGKDGIEKYTEDNAISKSFAKLLKKAKIKTEKGVGFYTLRRTAATNAAKSKDPFAVQRLLGHTDLKMAATYVQDVSEQTDRVINDMRKLIIQDDSSPLADASSGRDE